MKSFKLYLIIILLLISINFSEAYDISNIRMSRAPLPNAIDPANYILGPTDGLIISIWGEIVAIYPLAVSPEGTILVPPAGEISVDGLTINEAEEKIYKKLTKHYRNFNITLTLSSLRNFRIYVLGEISRPGMYSANSFLRVSDMLDFADFPDFLQNRIRPSILEKEEKWFKRLEPKTEILSLEEERYSKEEGMMYHQSINRPSFTKMASLRNIQLIRKDDTILNVDLFAWAILGDIEKNPFYRELTNLLAHREYFLLYYLLRSPTIVLDYS